MRAFISVRKGLSVALLSASVCGPVAGQTKDGAALGGLAGAVIGGIVGHQNDEAIEGVLIGGAVGAVTGGVIGHARQNAQPQPRYYQPAPVYHAPPVYQTHVHQQSVPVYTTQTTTQTTTAARRPVSIADVITLARSGVNDGVIINQMNANGIQARPEVNEVVLLHQQGVSDLVISAMQNAPVGVPSTVTTYATPAPVVVQEQPVIVTRQVYTTPPTYYRQSNHFHSPYRRSY